MEILLLALVGIAVWHFVYEAIIAPSLRMVLRHKMFRLRDQVRRLRAESPDEVSEEVFDVMQGLINNGITLVHQINFVVLFRVKNSEPIDSLIERRNQLIKDCPKEEIHEIRKSVANLLAVAFGINHGGWAIYIVPVLVISLFANTIWNGIKATAILPDEEIDKFLPAV